MRVLCPVLVPKPLQERGVLLANIAFLDYLLAASLSGMNAKEAGEEVSRLRSHIESLYRKGCEVCGKRVKEVVERWDYVVTRERGIAIFDKFIPVCEKCLQAVRFNPDDRKEVKKAIKLLAKVNKLKKDQVEDILQQIIEYWRLASNTSEWKIYVDRLEEMGIGKRVSEPILNSAALGEISLADRKLTIFNPSRGMHTYLLYEDIDALCTRRYDASNIGIKASTQGIEPTWSNLDEHIERLLHTKKFCKGEEPSIKLLEGAWVIYVNRRIRAHVVKEALRLARRGDLWSSRIETPSEPKEPAPIYFYVHSFVDISFQRHVVEEIKRLVAGAIRGIIEARFYPRSPEGRLARYHLFKYVIHSKA